MIDYLNTFLLLFAVIDPLGSVPVFLEATKQFNNAEKRSIALRASLVAALVLTFFIIVGQIIIEGMEVTLDAFQISGGIILFLFALTMIFGEGKPENEKHMIKDFKKVTVFPIAIPSIASPGAIMAVVLLTDNHIYSITQQSITTLLMILVVGLTGLLLVLARYIQEWIGEQGITVISKIMGLILASYATQSILSGLKSFFVI
ncbi:MarC family protein [Mangrovibacterium sp.]|uniref:MarC family protein n=1 Tax=Mangrovibacterium sp. TaxID=1961364 RepID=UPI003561F186